MARTEATELRINGTTEMVAKDSVLVEQRDTLIEVTTITIDRNEAGEIKTMPSGDNRMDTAFWEINVSDNSL